VKLTLPKAKKLVSINPAEEIDVFNGDDKEIHLLSPEQVNRLLKEARTGNAALVRDSRLCWNAAVGNRATRLDQRSSQ